MSYPVLTETGLKIHLRDVLQREGTLCGRWIDEDRTRRAGFGPRWKSPNPHTDPVGAACLHCLSVQLRNSGWTI